MPRIPASPTTFAAVQDLTTSQLDHLHDAQSDAIGAVLGHIAAVDVTYQVATFEGRDLNADERQQWETYLDLGERARREVRGHALDCYLKMLADVRQETLKELGRRTDEWLYEQSPFWGLHPANNYFKPPGSDPVAPQAPARVRSASPPPEAKRGSGQWPEPP